MGHQESSPKREIHNITGLSQKKLEKSQINDLTSHLKDLEKKPQQIKPKASRRKEIIKIRAEISAIESKKQYKSSINPRAGSLKGLTRLINLYLDSVREKEKGPK